MNHNDNSINSINYFINNNDEILFNIPTIKIYDIIHGTTQSLSNETLDISYRSIYNFNVTYTEISNNNNVSRNFLLTNSGSYKQNYTIYDNLSLNDSSLNRQINIEIFNPFINLNYIKDFNNNKYKKNYHEINTKYRDLLGNAYDYLNGQLTFNIFNSNNYYGIDNNKKTFNEYF